MHPLGQAALLRSPDPLLSYRAATFLVEAAISPSDFPLGAWYLDRIGTLVAADRHYITCLPPPPRGVANLIEACRRLVGTLEEADEEEEEEAAEEAKESARKPGAQWDCLMWIAFQLSALKR